MKERGNLVHPRLYIETATAMEYGRDVRGLTGRIKDSDSFGPGQPTSSESAKIEVHSDATSTQPEPARTMRRHLRDRPGEKREIFIGIDSGGLI
jgi:hypothetical protein